MAIYEPKTKHRRPRPSLSIATAKESDAYRSFLIAFTLSVGILVHASWVSAAGQSPIREMSNTVEALCPRLADLNNQGLLSAAQQDVFLRCREVKIQSGEDFEDLTEDDLNALDNMTSTQTSAMNRVTVEFAGPQVATVTGRMQNLRAGIGGGLALQMNTDPREPVYYAGPVTDLPSDSSASTRSSMWNQGRLGVFINGSMGTGDRDRTAYEPGFDYDAYTMTAGVDYRFTNNLVIGTAFGYSSAEADIDLDGGNIESDGYGGLLYATYFVGEFYMDIIGMVGKKDYSIVRNVDYSIVEFTGGGTTTVDQTFTGDPDATEYGFSAGVGYNFFKWGFTFQPYGQLNYLDTEIGGYTESLDNANTDAGFGLALAFEDQSITSLISSFGGRLSYAVTTSLAVLIPQISFDWQHEYENDSRNITARFVNGIDHVDNLILIPTDDRTGIFTDSAWHVRRCCRTAYRPLPVMTLCSGWKTSVHIW